MAKAMMGMGMVAVALLAGCGSDEVTGDWCGKPVETAEACAGDEALYAVLEQDGDAVSGNFCEEYAADCSSLVGRIEGDTLTFSYSFTGGAVEGTFTFDGDVLEGALYSTKCDCEIETKLHRL